MVVARTTISDCGRSKLPSKTSGPSRYQNPNIHTSVSVSSVDLSPLVVANSIDTGVNYSRFLLFPIQISIERRLKLYAQVLDLTIVLDDRTTILLQEQAVERRLMCIGRSQHKPFLTTSCLSIFQNRYYQTRKDLQYEVCAFMFPSFQSMQKLILNSEFDAGQ